MLVERGVGVDEVHARIEEGLHVGQDLALIGDLRLHVRVVDHHRGDRRDDHADPASEFLGIDGGGLGEIRGIGGVIARLRIDAVPVDEETVRQEIRVRVLVVRRRREVHPHGELGDGDGAGLLEILQRTGEHRLSGSHGLDVDAALGIDGNGGDGFVGVGPVHHRPGGIRRLGVGVEHGAGPDGEIQGVL